MMQRSVNTESSETHGPQFSINPNYSLQKFKAMPETCSNLFKEAVLFVGNGSGRLGNLAPLLPQTCPHVLLLEQRVQLCEGVQNLLR